MQRLLFLVLFGVIFAQTPACTFPLPSTCNSTGCPVTIPKNSFISLHYICDICNASVQVASRATDEIQIFSPIYLLQRLYHPLTQQEADLYVPYTEFTNLSTTCSKTTNVQVRTSGAGLYFFIYCSNTDVDCIVWYQIDVIVIQLNCAPNCPYEILFSSKCDINCRIGACNFQDSNCDMQDCSPGCTLAMVNNNVCDNACNTEPCAYDNHKCGSPVISQTTTQTSTTNSQQNTNAGKSLKLFV